MKTSHLLTIAFLLGTSYMRAMEPLTEKEKVLYNTWFYKSTKSDEEFASFTKNATKEEASFIIKIYGQFLLQNMRKGTTRWPAGGKLKP